MNSISGNPENPDPWSPLMRQVGHCALLALIVSLVVWPMVILTDIPYIQIFGDLYTLFPIFFGVLLIRLRLKYPDYAAVGLPYVIGQIYQDRGRLPLGNTIFQWFGVCLAVAGGFAIGTVGPTLHIGAGVANEYGRRLDLDRKTKNLLLSAGACAALSFLLHTPVAAVLLIMETMTRELNPRKVFLLIVASSLGSLLATTVGHPMLDIGEVHVNWDELTFGLPILIGIIGSLVGACFIVMIQLMLKAQERFSIRGRYFFVVLLTFLAGIFTFEVMGHGHNLQALLSNVETTSLMLLVWLMLRMLISGAAIAATIPGGFFGPTMVLGALLGGCIGLTIPDANLPFYMCLGIAAMLGSVMRLPLTAAEMVAEISDHWGMLPLALVSAVIAFEVQSRVWNKPDLLNYLVLKRYKEVRRSPIVDARFATFIRHRLQLKLKTLLLRMLSHFQPPEQP